MTNVIDRCLAAASSCVELGNDRRAVERMKSEFREVAREVSLWHLDGETKADLFLLPMEEELVIRHGEQVGHRLYIDFVDAFWIQTWADVSLDLVKLERNVPAPIDWQREIESGSSLRRMIAGRDYSSNYSNN